MAMLLVAMMALTGCVGMGYPYYGGHAYGNRSYVYRPVTQPYYGYYGGYPHGYRHEWYRPAPRPYYAYEYQPILQPHHGGHHGGEHGHDGRHA